MRPPLVMPTEEPNVVYLSKRRRSQQGDDVLDRIVRDHEHAIRRFLRARLANHPDYEDVVQEIYLKLAEQQDLSEKLSMGEAQSRYYLITMASNLVRDRYRRKAVRREVPLSLADQQGFENLAPSPEDLLISRQNVAAIKKAVLKLPAKCRRAFLLSRVRNLSYREIAEDMNISISMVEKHIMRALTGIRASVDLPFPRVFQYRK